MESETIIMANNKPNTKPADPVEQVVLEADKKVKISNDKLFVTEKQFVALNDAAESAGEIKKIENQGITSTMKAYKLLQSAAVNWLRHVEKYRDTRVLNDLIKRMESAQISPQPMGEFIMKFAPVSYDLKLGFVLNDSKPFDIKGAMSKPWWKTGKPQKFIPYDMELAFAGFIKSAMKHLDAPKEGDKVNTVLFEKLFKIANEYELLQENDSLDDEQDDSVSEDIDEPEVQGERAA